jgi:Leucine-rich repeat (LRR) protein
LADTLKERAQAIYAQSEQSTSNIRVAETKWDLKKSGLTSVPACSLSPQTITVIDFSQNKFEELPDLTSFGNLASLNASNNVLKSVPESLYQLEKLKTLELANNQLTDGSRVSVCVCVCVCS